ncbi:hypothetical protein LCGC14_1287910, partial [marine sediment metagenome]
GKIWRYDCYDIRKFKPGEIDTFLDIGANVGSFSLQAKVLNPTAKVISLEPCKETFETLLINMKQWKNTGIECYNICLGDGTLMYFDKRRHDGMSKFLTTEETHKWPKKYGYTIESKTLKKIFDDHKINREKPYIIKMDCEGGERFMRQEEFLEESLDIIRGSVQTMMEVHVDPEFGGSKDQWNSFFDKLKNTHELRLARWEDKENSDKRYIYAPVSEMPYEKGKMQIELIDKKWIGPWPGKGK